MFGPGGAGKGTIAARLVETDPRLWLSRSWTTRARRPGEPVDAYCFVDRPTFEDRVAAGGFFEWAEFLGNLYGTPLPEPPEGSDVLLEIDLQGAQQVRSKRPDARLILLVPPSDEIQAQRLRGRGDDEEHVAKRLRAGADEVRAGRAIADAEVVNDDLVQAVADVAGIVDRYRSAASAGGTAVGGPGEAADAPPTPPDDPRKGP
ncbi:MAG: guanylate kinase [Acidimicrobiales bacterium]